MADDRRDLESMIYALNRSAERLQTLWFSFVGISLYFILTALTTTHRMILLEEAQNLPIVGIKVPLLPFYIIAPVFFVVIHFYVLLMMLLLARTARVFEDELQCSIPLESERETFRMRVENALFLQLLIGGKQERSGISGLLLSTMALITIAVAPVITLIVLQMKFLPYHHFLITWEHRAMVALDVLLVLLLWRGYRVRWGSPIPRSPWRVWRERGRLWFFSIPTNWLLRSLCILIVGWVALVEGRWAGEPSFDPTEGGDVVFLERIGLITWAERYYAWQVPPAKGVYPVVQTSSAKDSLRQHGFRPLFWAGLFPDRLALNGAIIVGAARLDQIKKERDSRSDQTEFIATYDFRGRDFTKADFSEADLRGLDFRSDNPYQSEQSTKPTILRKVNFVLAKLEGTQFRRSDLQGANFHGALM